MTGKARAPASIRGLLRGAIERLDKGPNRALRGQGKSKDWRAGADEEADCQRGWRESWILDELRKTLAYLDGEYTAHEVTTYGLGHDYGRTVLEARRQGEDWEARGYQSFTTGEQMPDYLTPGQRNDWRSGLNQATEEDESGEYP